MEKQQFTIGFYNVENLFDTENDPYTNDDCFLPESPLKWDDERYGKKIQDLARVILSFPGGAPALLGLAEVENAAVLGDLQEELNWQGLGLDYIHEESPDERGIDVALLTNPELFQYIEHDVHPVYFEHDPTDRTRDILQVVGMMGGEEVHVFVNHWPSRGEGVEKSEPKRKAAAQTLRDVVDGLFEENPEARILIMGDLNDYPTDTSLTQVLRANGNPNYTAAELLNLSHLPHSQGKGSHQHKGEWGMLDHLIVSQGFAKPQEGLRLESESTQLMDADWLMYRNHRTGIEKPSRTYAGRKYHGGYSDHLPVYLNLTT